MARFKAASRSRLVVSEVRQGESAALMSGAAKQRACPRCVLAGDRVTPGKLKLFSCGADSSERWMPRHIVGLPRCLGGPRSFVVGPRAGKSPFRTLFSGVGTG